MRIILLLTALLFAVSSCRTPDSRGNIVRTSGDKTAIILYENADTLTMRNISVFSRINGSLKDTDILPVEIGVFTPEGKFRTDTVTLTGRDIIDNKNNASGTSDLSRVIFEDVVLQEKGEYTFSMRIINESSPEYLIGIIID